MACREFRLIRTLDDIASASTVSRKEISRSYRFLVKELNFHIQPSKSSDYISKFSNKPIARDGFEEIAKKILEAARELRMTSGRGPRGMAAAASYMA